MMGRKSSNGLCLGFRLALTLFRPAERLRLLLLAGSVSSVRKDIPSISKESPPSSKVLFAPVPGSRRRTGVDFLGECKVDMVPLDMTVDGEVEAAVRLMELASLEGGQ